jgi:type I restriction enzyme S subunit
MSKEPIRFKQTEIGELPEGWEVKKLGEIATIKQGGRLGLTKKDYVPEGYPAFSATGQDGYVSVYEYEGEAIILSSIGAQCGKCFYATGKWTTLANTQIIFVNPEIANTLFIFYQVNRPNFWMRLGSAQPFIRPSDVKNAKVIIPPLEEQKRIAGVLRLVDRVAEETRRIVDIYERAKRFALKRLLTRGIGHTRFKQTEMGELPEEWEVVRAEEDFEITIGRTPRRNQLRYWDRNNETDNFWATIEDLKERFVTTTKERISDEGVRAYHMRKVPEGTVLVSFKLTIGRVAIAGRPLYFNEAIAAFLPKLNCRFNRDFLFYALHLLPIWAEQQNLIDPAVKGSTLNKEKLQRLLLPLPPLEEQKQIAEMLGTIDAAIENERRYLGVLEKCKRWLLDNLLTGKIRLSPEVDEILKGVLPDAF